MAKKAKGNTLLEIIISIAIMALLIIPVANLVINSSSGSKRNQNKHNETEVGQIILEKIQNIDEIMGGSVNIYSDDKAGYVGDVIMDVNKSDGNISTISCNNSKYDVKVIATLNSDYKYKNSKDTISSVTEREDPDTYNSDVRESYDAIITFFENGKFSINDGKLSTVALEPKSGYVLKIDEEFSGDILNMHLYENQGNDEEPKVYESEELYNVTIDDHDKKIQSGERNIKVLIYLSNQNKRLSAATKENVKDYECFDKDISFVVDSKCEKDISFEVLKAKDTKDKYVSGNVSVLFNNNPYFLTTYEKNYGSDIGDLYNITLDIRKHNEETDFENEERIFTSSIVKNIITK